MAEQPLAGAKSPVAELRARNESRTPRALLISAWFSFVLNVLIIATGGTVRLTGSGLGCTDWPVCTPGSLVPTQELGIHGIIEFANRTITGPLLIAALFVVFFAWRFRAHRPDLLKLSLVVLGLILMQAFVGAFVVWEELAAWLVGFHYTASLVIVCITAAFLVRAYEPASRRVLAVPRAYAILGHVTTFLMAITILVGVVTTGSGPHSGDVNIVRDGFDATILSHVHAWPGYLSLALVVAMLVWAIAASLRPRRWVLALLLTLLVQIVVGVYQARNGLPPVAVGIHMVLASLTAAAMTVTILRLKQPAEALSSN